MKHQYFGDVIDYRKYGVLRALAATTGLRLGICWFLTADDQPRHGELRRYLQQPGRWRQFDPDLYERLRRLLVPGTDRSVAHARHWDLVPGATYFEALLGDGPRARDEYFDAAWKAMADVLFLVAHARHRAALSAAPTAVSGWSGQIEPWP
jgi:hypothetical protein